MRARLLQAAFEEFYRNGFQGGSINRIVEKAGATKGALFHYFKTKAELGYAVVEEVIQPLGHQRWIAPLTGARDPVGAIQETFRRNLREDAANPAVLAQGCPTNNLAQEMSPIDEGFRLRIEACYASWREALTEALARARKQGQIRDDVSPRAVAALIVAAQMGIWGAAKNSQDPKLMMRAGAALHRVLDGLRLSGRRAARG
ncbi:MAG: TetR/AcrR family transcriptional regulator [Terriglobales bacterium]